MLHMLDTDTVSYLIKKHPPGLQQKFNALDPGQLCISVMTRAELQYGVQRLPSEHRLHLIVRQFLKIIRILSWDSEGRLACHDSPSTD